ncbi:Ribosomal RNA small subunit methyltransferase H [Actinomyces bovis]|uniref:Ribosomal RNA small subunit methyltransferase H n=1 Tax=Actinomyces bovis TaxID=1658 RepID=A0ABY1VP79_9ACTO|nr:16S rRNA (cytosine(1402)-N(4))-methyltransferase RsmH [Actinomyces bovis]SPT53924.1 Ribosomal RNA small subunit methyltransferase H [Actinomyces bovis]VEG53412.1 Ribosomal RNA small subunit methyltransferase H [Actinomyces israelii]
MQVSADITGETQRPTAERHTPVLLQRCLDLLAPAIESTPSSYGPVLIDCTLGLGGHTEAALQRFANLKVVGIDRDPQAIALASSRLAAFGERFQAVHTTYDCVQQVAAEQAQADMDGLVDGVLMDLGVSSLQLDDVPRGFSYARPAPLDMRMDQSQGRSAAELLATADAVEIARILRDYGEERFASRIAAAIVRRREAGQPVQTTDALVDVVRESIPAAARRTGGNPAKRTFQALRVAVNSELEVLAAALPRALDSLRVGGRLVVESYQSLEDRLVKTALTAGSKSRAPEGLPVIPEADRPYLELLVHGAEQADELELAANPRSAPVRLRAAERVRAVNQAPAQAKAVATPSSSRRRTAGRTDKDHKRNSNRRRSSR